MGRRTVLLIVAALIAALGTGMVFLYVRSADSRAEANQQPVQVLKAVAQINPGETWPTPQAAGKIQLGTVPRSPGARRRDEHHRRPGEPGGAVRRSTRTSRSSPASSAPPGDQDALHDPGRRDRHLGEPLRHRPGRRLREPGRDGRDLPDRPTATTALPDAHPDAAARGRGDRRRRHHGRSRPTTTDAGGAQTTEQLPETLFTLARRPGRGRRRSSSRPAAASLSFGLLNDKSKVEARHGRHSPRTCSGDLMPIIVESSRSNADLFTLGHRRQLATSSAASRSSTRLLNELPDEYAIVLGPAVDLEAAAALADTLRVTRPAISVILIRRRVDTSVLAEALRSGMREVVDERDLTGLGAAVTRAQRGLAGPRTGPAAAVRRAHRRPADHGLLPQGRRRQDHHRGQPRRSR